MASKSNPSMIHQFKIELLDTMPSIWRQIQVPSTFTMFELHGALNDAMGWQDYHYHAFKSLNLKTSQIDFVGRSIVNRKEGPVDGQSVMMINYFLTPGDTAEYWYDFVDRWKHRVVLQKILPAERDKCYPCCIDGKRACPPEDCGGTDGYNQLLEIIKNKDHPEYAGMINWLREAHNCTVFNPEHFIPANVHFRPIQTRKYPYNNTSEANFYDCIQM